jgi:hypothetical protein
MYSRNSREITLVKVNTPATVADIDDAAILEKAIALVQENSPEHQDLIERLTATVQSLFDQQHVSGLMAYRDRPVAIAKSVLNDLRYEQ